MSEKYRGPAAGAWNGERRDFTAAAQARQPTKPHDCSAGVLESEYAKALMAEDEQRGRRAPLSIALPSRLRPSAYDCCMFNGKEVVAVIVVVLILFVLVRVVRKR